VGHPLRLLHVVGDDDDRHLVGDLPDRLFDPVRRGRVEGRAVPPPVPAVLARWDSYASAGALSWESNVINVAHKLADFTLHEPCMLTRELFVQDPGYRDLGLTAQDADPLFDSAALINAELDRYLSP
jgi:hypothetical protein